MLVCNGINGLPAFICSGVPPTLAKYCDEEYCEEIPPSVHVILIACTIVYDPWALLYAISRWEYANDVEWLNILQQSNTGAFRSNCNQSLVETYPAPTALPRTLARNVAQQRVHAITTGLSKV